MHRDSQPNISVKNINSFIVFLFYFVHIFEVHNLCIHNLYMILNQMWYLRNLVYNYVPLCHFHLKLLLEITLWKLWYIMFKNTLLLLVCHNLWKTWLNINTFYVCMPLTVNALLQLCQLCIGMVFQFESR